MKRLWDDDELTAEWTLEPSDQPLLANKTGATRLEFAALLTFFRHEGRFPASKHEVPAAVAAHLARQVGVSAEACVAYDWPGRTIKYHRVQIRTALGFRETSVEDADQLVDWLTAEVVPHDRAQDRMRIAVSCVSSRRPLSASNAWFARPWLLTSTRSPRRSAGVCRQSRSRHWTDC